MLIQQEKTNEESKNISKIQTLYINKESMDWLKRLEKNYCPYVGFVYILETRRGEQVKIGSTSQPHTRLTTLISQATRYGCECPGFSISKPHYNYKENEWLMHKYFKEYRVKRTEVFNIDVFEATSIFQSRITTEPINYIKVFEKEEKDRELAFAFAPFLHNAERRKGGASEGELKEITELKKEWIKKLEEISKERLEERLESIDFTTAQSAT